MMENAPDEFLVVFCQGEGWWTKLLKRNFSHVFVVARNKRGQIVIDPKINRLHTEVYSPTLDLEGFYLRKGYIVRRVNARKVIKRFIPHIIPLMTCVSLCKYITGIKSKAITPYGIFKFLTKEDRL